MCVCVCVCACVCVRVCVCVCVCMCVYFIIIIIMCSIPCDAQNCLIMSIALKYDFTYCLVINNIRMYVRIIKVQLTTTCI